MRCPKCGSDLDLENNLHVEESQHDEQLLDIIIDCDDCGTKWNYFANMDEDFIEVDYKFD